MTTIKTFGVLGALLLGTAASARPAEAGHRYRYPSCYRTYSEPVYVRPAYVAYRPVYYPPVYRSHPVVVRHYEPLYRAYPVRRHVHHHYYPRHHRSFSFGYGSGDRHFGFSFGD